MKKLNFNEVKAKELLDIKSMRNVRGGGDSGTCGVKFIYPIKSKKVIGYQTITYIYKGACDMSYAKMTEAMAYGNISNWCCDSCPQTEYCG